MEDVLIIGSGIAGLSCAHDLKDAGRSVRLLERSRYPGGRIATRTLDDEVFDYGPVFFHGENAEFHEMLVKMAGKDLIPHWPKTILGRGTPCQPSAFYPGHFRMAVRGGMRKVTLALAENLTVETSADIQGLVQDRNSIRAESHDGRSWSASTVVLALATEQTLTLLEASPTLKGLPQARVLGLFPSVPAFSLAAVYPETAPSPPWDIFYPESGNILLVSNETAKHKGRKLLLVFQTKPAWSRPRLQVPSETWSAELLAEAGTLLGDWAATPDQTHPHRWTYARHDQGANLPGSLLVQREGSYLGITGDIFSESHGIEGAFLSGKNMAKNLLRLTQP